MKKKRKLKRNQCKSISLSDDLTITGSPNYSLADRLKIQTD